MTLFSTRVRIRFRAIGARPPRAVTDPSRRPTANRPADETRLSSLWASPPAGRSAAKAPPIRVGHGPEKPPTRSHPALAHRCLGGCPNRETYPVGYLEGEI